MGCFHHYALLEGGEAAFTVDASRVTFGRGCLAELGARTHQLGKRVALFTDANVKALPFFERAQRSLLAAGLEVALYDRVVIEPTTASFEDAIAFAKERKPDVYVSIGGGSVMDTAKAANLYATHPAELLTYVNAPIGAGVAPPGALKPHIACPTTSGTGSEVTGIAVFDLLALQVKTGIASPFLRPTEALVDPQCTATLPAAVVAASGMDVLCHALESFTARPYTQRPAPASPLQRPMSQGRNPWSDLGCREALSLLGEYFLRAVRDASDHEAREHVMWAATLAGIAFGNAGVHVPHAMAYAVAGQSEALIAHGVSVVLNAPAVFRATHAAMPERHLEAAQRLGADVRAGAPQDVLADRITEMMRAAELPNGLRAVGYQDAQVAALTKGAAAQRRLLDNAPIAVDGPVLERLFSQSLACW